MVYHVLNGDALKDKFPEHILGERIVLRECLVDGPVREENLEALYNLRAEYLDSDDPNAISYKKDVVPELNKLRAIEKGAQVYLWFEEDLFCQVNLWFAIYILKQYTEEIQMYLVLPFPDAMYGFGSLSQIELEQAFSDKIDITTYSDWSELWPAYQNHDIHKLDTIGEKYVNQFPFLLKSIQAHKDRKLFSKEPGRPEQTLLQIVKDLNNPGFGPVFREFCKREAVYGFGDIQVKRLYDSVLMSDFQEGE